MPRRLRRCPGGLVYHVLNRANARATIFRKDGDYEAFERVLAEALGRVPLEVLCYCLMPNHWHLVVRPAEDGGLSQFMRWLTVTHTQRWHAHYHTSGSGHLYQGRFKSFPVESDEHFLVLCRYVERNAVRAGLVQRAEQWRWSSLWRRVHGEEGSMLSTWPVEEPVDWLALVNRPQDVADERSLRACMTKGRSFGSAEFEAWTREVLELESAYREPGRPAKKGDRNDS